MRCNVSKSGCASYGRMHILLTINILYSFKTNDLSMLLYVDYFHLNVWASTLIVIKRVEPLAITT